MTDTTNGTDPNQRTPPGQDPNAPAEPTSPPPAPGGGTPQPPPQPQEPPPQQQPEQQQAKDVDWRDKRIATLTRRIREMQERQPQQQPTQQYQQPTPQQPQIPQDQFNNMVEQRAREYASVQDFNRRCDEVALQGRASFGEAEFNGRINNLQKLVDNTDPQSVQAYNNFLLAALESGEPAKVLYELGSDLNEAQRILGSNATRMAVEMVKRAARPPIEVSGAPKPVQPIGARGVANERINPDDPDRADHLSTAEWMRRRETQLADRRKAQQ